MRIHSSGPIGKHLSDHLTVQLQDTYFNQVHDGWSAVNKRRDFNQFYWFKAGEGTLTIEGEHFEPKPGQLFFIPAGAVRSYSTSERNPFYKYWCHFTAKVGTVNLFEFAPMPRMLDATGDEWLEDKFRTLTELYPLGGLAAQLKAKSVLLGIIAYYLDRSESEAAAELPTKKHDQLMTVLHYMEERLAEPISIRELAETVHLHPNYFIKLFRSIFGVPPIVYLNGMRIDKARQLLAGSALPVSDVAAAVGMELGYFSKCFKRTVGYSPSSFRKMVSSR